MHVRVDPHSIEHRKVRQWAKELSGKDAGEIHDVLGAIVKADAQDVGSATVKRPLSTAARSSWSRIVQSDSSLSGVWTSAGPRRISPRAAYMIAK